MSFINNPLGSGGTSYQGLGDLTAGVTALQRAEAQRRIEEIQQQKGWEHDEKIANEKWALEIGSTPRINDIRVGLAKKGAADAENMIKSLVDFEKSAPNMSAEQRMGKKMDIVMQQKKLLAANQNAKDMASAVEKMHLMVLSTRPKLSGSQLAEFDKQVADFSKKLSDPDESPKLTPYDAILAVQPPPPPYSMLLQQKAKELLPFVDEAIKDARNNGRTQVDMDQVMDVIKTSVSADDPLYSRGVEEKRVQAPDQMYEQLARMIVPSIGKNVTGWAPKDKPESEVLSGFEGLYDSSVREGERSKAYVFDKNKYKLKTSFTTPDGNRTNADMTPLAIKENGMVEGEFTVDEKVTSDPMSVGEANLLKIQTGGRLLPADKNGNVSVVYMQPKQYVSEVKMTPDMIEKIKRSDPKAAKYIEDTVDPYPKRTAAEKAGTAKKQTKTVKPKTDPLGLF